MRAKYLVLALVFSLSFAGRADSEDFAGACERIAGRPDCELTNAQTEVFDVLLASCRELHSENQCHLVADQDKVLKCDRSSLCHEYRPEQIMARAAIGCGDALVAFAGAILEDLWGMVSSVAKGLFRTLFCPMENCLVTAAEQAQRDQLMAMELAARDQFEVAWCEERGGCRGSAISCIQLENGCREDDDFNRCSYSMRESFYVIQAAERGERVPNRFEGSALQRELNGELGYRAPGSLGQMAVDRMASVDMRSDFTESLDYGRARSAFLRRFRECAEMKSDWENQKPDLLARVREVIVRIIEDRKREWICYQSGYQMEIVCRTLAEIGLVEGGITVLAARILEGFRAGKTVSQLSREIAANGPLPASEGRLLAPDLVPADFDDDIADFLRTRVQPEIDLNHWEVGEEFTRSPPLPDNVSALSDDEVLALLRQPSRGEMPALRAQLQTRVESIRGAEEWASSRGWSPEGTESLLRISDDFAPGGTDLPPSPRALSESPVMSLREGWYSVQIHGSPGSFYSSDNPFTARQLAEAIRRGGHDGTQPINLMSCRAGAVCPIDGYNSAQDLANLLGVPVVASTELIDQSFGTLRLVRRVGDRLEAAGEWRTFYPE